MSRRLTALLVFMLPAVFFSITSCAAAADDCLDRCTGTEADADGDGLDACLENCLGTSDAEIDSDSDGIPDTFEHTYSLDPLSDDARGNPDADEFNNLEEFLYASDPHDAASPYPAFYVAPDGDDVRGQGTAEAPWRTIAYALSQPSPVENGLVCVVLRSGAYYENVNMLPRTILLGERDSDSTIVGFVTGASRSTLKNLTLSPAADQEFLLDMNDADMKVSHVSFAGSLERNITGILMDGEGPAGSVIDACDFTNLGVGIDIGGEIPTVRRCTFGDIPAEFGSPARPGAGIIIRDYESSTPETKSIGESSDPREGWNDFLPTVEGFAVINERDEAVAMQGNYWGTTNPAEFPTRVSGSAVVLPVLAQSSAVLASTIFCTVWDGDDQKNIDSAEIGLTISAFDAVTQNDYGIYAFPAVSEGEYSLIVEAPGYESQSVGLSLGSGELKSITIALRTTQASESLELADVFAKGCALPEGSGANNQSAGGDYVLVAIALAAMLARRRKGDH